MQHAAYLAVWLAGLFVLIGVVFAGVARLVRKDTVDHDRRFLWSHYDRSGKITDGEEGGRKEKTPS